MLLENLPIAPASVFARNARQPLWYINLKCGLLFKMLLSLMTYKHCQLLLGFVGAELLATLSKNKYPDTCHGLQKCLQVL